MRVTVRVLVVLLAALWMPVVVCAQPAPLFTIVGQVLDETGGVLPGATVQLINGDGTLRQSSAADAAGAFRFDGLASGRYNVRVLDDGFRTTTVRVAIANRPPAFLRVTLPLAGVTQEIVVSGREATVSSDAGGNADALTLDATALQRLPILNADVLGTLSQLLDTAAVGSGGVTLVVNGMEVNSLGVSASAIQQIKINSDPYSAEYSRPGRGRIEILTKPGSQTFHGELNAVARDAVLDARNAFAATPPSEARWILEGSMSGPLGRNGTRSFIVSAQTDSDDQQLFIVAQGLTGEIRDSVPVANRHRLVSGSVTLQAGRKTTIAIRPSYEYTSNPNRGVGGTTLASAGWIYEHTEDAITFLQQTVINPRLVNQFQLLAGYEDEPSLSASPLPAVVVDGSLRAGGAQNTVFRTERHFQASESLSWTHGDHFVQTGVQVPDLSWRRFDDQTNTGGTYSFASLQTYLANQPYAFTQQQGNGRLTWLEKVVGIYVKDDWHLRPNISLSLGLRYDWANYFSDTNNLAPRFSGAYVLGKRDVIRAGGGIFYDKIGPNPVVAVLQSQPGGLRRFVVTNPGPSDVIQSSDLQSAAQSVTAFAPGIQIRYTFQDSAGLEHQVIKGTTFAITYTGLRGTLFRSRDLNAPLPPAFGLRPNSAYGQIREIESDGHQESHALQAILRGKVTKWFNGQMQYTVSRSKNDTDGLSYFPSNDYDLSGEWSRASYDRRQRFVVLGRVTAGRQLDLGVSFNIQSGAPYSEVLPGDPLNNGRGNARPSGVGRNSLQGGAYSTLDLRLSRDVILAKGTPHAQTLTIALDGFNVLNRVNYVTYVGTVTAPLFGQPVTARSPRQLQLSARLRF